MEANTFITNAHPEFIDNLYKEYKVNPDAIDSDWKRFFDGFDFAIEANKTEIDEVSENGQVKSEFSAKEFQVYNLIMAYRKRAHLLSDTNPIRARKDRKPGLALSDFGLSEADLETSFNIGKEINIGKAKLKDILAKLKKVYCADMGFEFDYISDSEVRNWLQNKIENRFDSEFDIPKKKRILEKLNETVVFEKFLGTKFLGEKRFSLEGGESTIPAIDACINKSAELGVQEVVIGMAHRGRLNVLANLMGKTYDYIFKEFEGHTPDDLTMGTGDVKYHLGYSSLLKTTSGENIHLKLTPNPSHLEAVDPVVLGFARAKADAIYKSDYDKVLPILIHGDAAIAGQGIVYEIAQMSGLPGYYVGGTIHFVINNQIGFTTDFDDARTSHYCTSVASVVNAPVIHVNGDKVEAVVYALELAAEFRNKFNRDIYVDMVCYRKHGHNEGDDPKFTQPSLYNLIDKHLNPRDIYIEELTSTGKIEKQLADNLDKEFWKMLQQRLDSLKQEHLPYKYQEPEQAWRLLKKASPKDFESSPKTAVTKALLKKLVKKYSTLDKNFKPLRKVDRLLKRSEKQILEENKVDWSGGELLAYASILEEGKDIRMSGQDVKRGTFSHRHAVLYDSETAEEYNRLNNINPKKSEFRIYNSLLSEFAVLGFEFGYSIANPNNLVVWEAQFGDFANGAQTMIDQFVMSSESKWQRSSGLIMLLPHGYEGQGPEHSSARLERFLQGCAEFNVTVANITTPANLFHALRRQLARPFRKPLIIMSPKSLLRHPQCVSTLDDFAKGGFQEIIANEEVVSAAKVKRVLLCSGKMYYELLEYKEANKKDDTVIIRLEQIYPLPYKQLNKVVGKYKNAKVAWVQEESANMGAWTYMLSCYRDVQLEYFGRKASASPATGFKKIHLQEQQNIIANAFKF